MIRATGRLPADEEPQILARAKAGDQQAIVQAIASVIKLVRHDAVGWAQGRTDDIGDLAQVGLIGVLHAIEKFDPAYGIRFASYAAHWWRKEMRVESRMQQVARGRSGARAYLIGRYYQLRKAMVEAERDGRDPAQAVMAVGGMGHPYAKAFVEMHQPWVSLEAPIGDNGELKFGDKLRDMGASPDESVAISARDAAVREAIDSLPERMRNVMLWRYFGRELTLAEVGKRLGVCRERARQLEVKAMGMLREKLADHKEAA